MAHQKGTFTKGDMRINRKGRPKTFLDLRKLALRIANERPDGETVSRIESILREWSTSGNHLLQMRFTEIAYGKLPNEGGGDVPEGGGKIIVEFVQPGDTEL